VVDYQHYERFSGALPQQFDYFVKGSMLLPLLHLGLGLWQLMQGGPEFVWAVPATLHFVVSIFIGILLAKGKTTRKLIGGWMFGWLAANLLALLLPAIGAGLQSGWLHLSQCLSCLVVVFVYDLWKGWIAMHSGENSADHNTASSMRTLRTPTRGNGQASMESAESWAVVNLPPHAHVK
jgi:hypothetical protein